MQVLTSIANACFETETFRSEQAKQIIKYIKQKYNADLEFLWGKFPNNTIWRRADTNKWFGVFVQIAQNKIGLSGNDNIELIVMRANPAQVETLKNKKGYAPAYHMNKKSWISVLLNNTLPLSEIETRLDESFLLAIK